MKFHLMFLDLATLFKAGFRIPRSSLAIRIGGKLIPIDGMGKIIVGVGLIWDAAIHYPPTSDKPLNAMLVFHIALSFLLLSIGITDCLVIYKVFPRKLDFRKCLLCMLRI